MAQGNGTGTAARELNNRQQREATLAGPGRVPRGSRLLRGLDSASPVLFFLFVFFLYYALLSNPYFTDEEDVFYGAYHVIRGMDIYRGFLSQHMPFSYYFLAPVALLGARTVFQFRLGTYVLLSLVWEAAYLRHRRTFHPAALFAMPLFYLTVLRTLNMGTTMISDHWQGIGLVLILLEVVRYMNRREITLPCAGMVCLGILLSLGSTFASAYSLLCYFLAMVWLQIRAVRQDRREGDPAGRLRDRRYLKEDLRLAGICVAPFALLMGWYLITGNVANFFSGAYEIVTRVYPRYTGGFGSDPVSVVWTTVIRYGRYLLATARQLPGALWPNLLYLLLAAGLVCGTVLLGRKSKAAALLIFLAAVYGGLRDFDAFHGLAYQAQASALCALCVGAGLSRALRRPGKIRLAAAGTAALCGLALTAPFVVWAGYNLIYPQILLPRTLRCEEQLLDLLTDPGETVFPCNQPVNSLDVMDLDLTPKEASGAIAYPYFYEMWGDRQMASIRDNPRVVLYDGEESIWGYVFREYAPDFDAYMAENYTRLPQAETIWVSEDFLPEAESRLRAAGYGDRVVSNVKQITENRPQKYYPGSSLTARFTAEAEHLTALRFCAACYHRRSDPTLRILLREAESGLTVGEAEMRGAEIADTFFSRCLLRAELTAGKEYEVEIRIEAIAGKGDMEFYFTPAGTLALAQEYD